MIDALRKCYELKELLRQLNIAKSSYEYAREVAGCTEKYRNLREKAKKIFGESNRTYGYRRIHSEVVKTYGKVSEKVIRGIMKSKMLKVVFVSMSKYCSYCGEVSPAVPNLVMRDFHAESPNQLILSDITEFNIPAGKVYFSPAIDCFDGMPIAWTIGTSPNAELVNAMLDDVIDKLKPDEHPIVHTDRGGHYRWPGWIERMDKAGLKRSMSKKGCCADNSACEGFFGHLKSEMFYGRSWANVSIQEFIEKLNGYIIWYREKRIKETIGYQSPLEYRRGLCLAR